MGGIEVDTSAVGKNIWYASISFIVPPALTYVFWFVAAKVAGAEALGVASSIASMVIIITTINVFDMHLGMKRFLGIAMSEQDWAKFKQIFISTCIFIAITATITAVFLSTPNFKILEKIGIDERYAWLIFPMILVQSFQFVFIEALIVAFQSKKVVIAYISGSICRFPVLFGAIYLFNVSPTTATIAAFSSTLFISSIWFAMYLKKVFHKSRIPKFVNILSDIKEILRAGLSSWVPNSMKTIGYQLGIIAVLSSGGATEAGKLYITMGIFLVSLFIVTGITRVTHSLFASLQNQEDRIKLLSYTTNIAFIFTLPITMPLLFFGKDFLGLMGTVYRSTATSMSIFIISLPLLIVSEMIYYFVYGRGDNKAVFYLGIAGNVPRIVLYFLLSPALGINGAALSWLVGSIIQLILSLKVKSNYSLVMEFKKYTIITLIPFFIGSIVYLVALHFVISSLIIFFGSFTLYIKLKIFTKSELHDVVYSGLPYNIAQRVYPLALKIIDKIG